MPSERDFDVLKERANNDDNTGIKGIGSRLGEVIAGGIKETTTLFRFPEHLGDGTEDNLGNIIKFSIFTYKGGGYNRLSGNGSQDLITNPKGRRIADIALSIPSKSDVSYKSTWSHSGGNDMDSRSAWLEGASAAEDIVNKRFDIEKTGKNFIGSGLIAAFKAADKFTAGAASVYTGWTAVPYIETIFEKIDFRSFDFKFKLIPRNVRELQKIADIIQVFKWASAPGLAGILKDNNGQFHSMGAKLFTYPNVFQIRYITNSPEGTEDSTAINPWLHRFQPSICNSVDISYNGSEALNFVSYHNPSENDFRQATRNSINTTGAPIYYSISLKFTELAYVTKESINQGY